MSDGHADQILAKAGKPEPPEKPAPPIDPALYQRDDVRRIPVHGPPWLANSSSSG